MDRPEFPIETIRRLPLYLRCFNRLIVLGKDTMTSEELSKFLAVNSGQLRKDLSYFGDFGTRGVGYDLRELIEEIRTILRMDKDWNLAVAGIGNISQSLLDHIDFDHPGFRIVYAFDEDESLIGTTFRGVNVRPLDELPSVLEDSGIQIGILAVSDVDARVVADQFVDCGIKGIINLTRICLNMSDEIQVVQMDLSSELGRLVYQLENN
ncbi:redox-sensing transcriptional repressor Rex [Candidatus Bipolaricaulota bacterium]|nr:redox-sensing transcriptional repressor Rex [Candidatus Bipolaricaulota bacterium]